MFFDINPEENAQTYIFSIIKEYYGGKANSQRLMKLLYAALLIELSRKYQSSCLPDPPDFMRIMSFISDNWSTVTLVNICQKFRISQSTLSRMFRERVGVDFSDHMRRFRMDKAKHFLAQTELGIEKLRSYAATVSAAHLIRNLKSTQDKRPHTFEKMNKHIS